MSNQTKVSLPEALGLRPLPLALRQISMTLRGDEWTPKSRFDTSSLRLLTPRLAVRTWLGRKRKDRLLPVLNFVNRTPTPVTDGWSVRVTQVRDWRGGDTTYDSHNGTDFVAPPGSRVCAAAPGRVLSVCREYHRGGLKLFVAHAHGLVTTHNHLARALVSVGDTVQRGQPIALSGAAGIDSTFTFPWLAPHLHYNVWQDGVAVDPFAAEGETSLWRVANDPKPHDGATLSEPEPEPFEEDAVQAVLDVCLDPRLKALARDTPDLQQRAMLLLRETVTYPTRFSVPEAGRLLYPRKHERVGFLDLPFHREDFDGVLLDAR